MPVLSRNVRDRDVRRLRYSHAVDLARAGAYKMALAVLVPTLDSAVTEDELVAGTSGILLEPQELDILARIYVQQDRFAEARACWKRAILACPNEQTYLRALEVLDEYQERLHLRDRIINILYVSMAIVGIFSVTLLLVFKKLV